LVFLEIGATQIAPVSLALWPFLAIIAKTAETQKPPNARRLSDEKRTTSQSSVTGEQRLKAPAAGDRAASKRQRAHSPALRECVYASHRRSNGPGVRPPEAALDQAVLAPANKPAPPARSGGTFAEKNQRSASQAAGVGVACADGAEERQRVLEGRRNVEEQELVADDPVQADADD
jgi:hypothetical protein